MKILRVLILPACNHKLWRGMLVTHFLILVTGHGLLVTSATAQVPSLINYQGRLVQGTNLYNGTAAITFRLYTNAVGGSSLFESTNTTTVVDGLYATSIGQFVTVGSLNAALENPAVWLEVAVNGSTLSPRERVLAVPYAYMAHRLGALRVETNADGAPNLIGGASINTVGPGVIGSTIGGGGVLSGLPSSNRVDANFATIGGGTDNTIETNCFAATIGGGYKNSIATEAFASTISGGRENDIEPYSDYSAIGGGDSITIRSNADGSVIGGGFQNIVGEGAMFSTIGGGYNNQVLANGEYGTVPGGAFNWAAKNSFAAGNGARATHSGSFVWSDAQGPLFETSASNQFLIRADGNVGINTNNPKAMLHVAGDAVIGPSSNAPRFAMEFVALAASGVAFRHPADTNLSMIWDSANRILTVTNTAAAYYDVQMQLIEESNSISRTVSRDISTNVSPNFLRLTNSIVQNAGWSVTTTREASPGPGFQFNGSGFAHRLNGLIIYWY